MKRFVFFLSIATLASLFYVYEEVEAVKTGYKIRKQQEIKARALDHARSLQYNIASLKAPNNLEKKLLLERIELASPKSWNTLVLSSGRELQRSNEPQFSTNRSPFFTKFFIGTAQAEAKET